MTLKPAAETASLLKWIKSSHSTPDGPDCVEVAATSRTIHVRDSKNTQGPHLGFHPNAWTDFVTYASRS